ncbi:hypothetical protein NQ317_002548 [Molorchus minor]|uniref:Uncharacterized protein n=1 Tax=Molorchus minor TaxID=1323400 RepID=A0ABQ9JTJ2_9CUCU|nr:hypothetical protein NQ317_002548 [Molorchus minor]
MVNAGPPIEKPTEMEQPDQEPGLALEDKHYATEDTEPKCDGVHGCGPVFEHGNAGNSLKEYMFDRPKTAPRSKDSVGSDKSSLLKKRAKSANNIHQIGGDSSHSTASSSSASKKL